MPAPHPPEFRQRAVDLARSTVKPIGEIARDLSISESCLRNWLAQADADEGRSSSARLTGNDRPELRRKARRLEVENETLKRAAAYFARENVLPK